MGRFFLVLVALFILMATVIANYTAEPEYATEEDFSFCGEYSEMDSTTLNVTHYRDWLDYYRDDNFCSAYSVAGADVEDAGTFRNAMYVNRYLRDNEFWGEVYRQLYEANKDHLATLQDSLLSLSASRMLDRPAFARAVVALVQDMPYEYVMPHDCEGYTSSPCNPDVRFGLYSPIEFLYTMKGDCDTRTVLLFTLLKNLGYDPLIINSTEYGHSMLALDIPSAGEDFEYRGRRYAYWETTNVGWLPGMLPPDMKNESYWDVVLAYE